MKGAGNTSIIEEARRDARFSAWGMRSSGALNERSTAPTSTAVTEVALLPLHLDDDAPAYPATLPRDYPAWQRDLVVLSRRARALLAAAKPAVIRVVQAWEQRIRSVPIGTRLLMIDAIGCYRLR